METANQARIGGYSVGGHTDPPVRDCIRECFLDMRLAEAATVGACLHMMLCRFILGVLLRGEGINSPGGGPATDNGTRVVVVGMRR